MTMNSWYIPADLSFITVNEDNDEFIENVPKDLKDLRRKLELVQFNEGLSILAIAVAEDEDRNRPQSIPALTGDPINVNVHDFVKDFYYVYCFSYFDIGSIPVNYKLCIKGVHEWMIDVPLPSNIISKYLTEDQKKDYDEWKKSLGSQKDFRIETIQAVNVY